MLLLARLYEKQQEEVAASGSTPAHTEVVDVPFDLTACDDIAVSATNGFNVTPIEYAISQSEDNCLAVNIPHTLTVGTYALEVTCKRNGYHVRSFEFSFGIVNTNCDAQTTFEVVDGCNSASLRVTLQIVPQAEVRGQNSYEMWKELPGNEGKTLQDYIDEVLDLNGLTSRLASAETRRELNEQGRQASETNREEAEADRRRAENTRVVNEQARELSETRRVNAETERGRVASADHQTAASDHQTALSDHQTAARQWL